MAATCDQIGPELVAFLDGELDDAERRPIASHVSTCLGCRREMERLGTVRGWVADLPRIEPSAGLADEFWRRVEHERAATESHPGASPLWWWVTPALAAAAALVLAFQFFTSGPTPVAKAPSAERAVAGARPGAPAPAVAARRAAPEAAAPMVADADTLRPEDLPPELLEHPELFLRLPVVRRLDKLEHFEEVRQHPGEDGEGAG